MNDHQLRHPFALPIRFVATASATPRQQSVRCWLLCRLPSGINDGRADQPAFGDIFPLSRPSSAGHISTFIPPDHHSLRRRGSPLLLCWGDPSSGTRRSMDGERDHRRRSGTRQWWGGLEPTWHLLFGASPPLGVSEWRRAGAGREIGVRPGRALASPRLPSRWSPSDTPDRARGSWDGNVGSRTGARPLALRAGEIVPAPGLIQIPRVKCGETATDAQASKPYARHGAESQILTASLSCALQYTFAKKITQTLPWLAILNDYRCITANQNPSSFGSQCNTSSARFRYGPNCYMPKTAVTQASRAPFFSWWRGDHGTRKNLWCQQPWRYLPEAHSDGLEI